MGNAGYGFGMRSATQHRRLSRWAGCHSSGNLAAPSQGEEHWPPERPSRPTETSERVSGSPASGATPAAALRVEAALILPMTEFRGSGGFGKLFGSESLRATER